MALAAGRDPFSNDGRPDTNHLAPAPPQGNAASKIVTPFRLVGDAMAWFGGAQPSTLRHCPSERMRLAGLGLAVLITGLFGGAAAAFATSYFLHRPALSLWPVGLAWAIAIANIDRLLIMMGGTRRRLLITIPVRLALAVPVGLLIAEILLLQIFEPEENALISATQQARVTQEISRIEDFYQPKIAAAQGLAAQGQQQLETAVADIEQHRFLAGCESGDTRCSTTRRLGCGAYCQHYSRVAESKQAHLDSIRPAIERDITASLASLPPRRPAAGGGKEGPSCHRRGQRSWRT